MFNWILNWYLQNKNILRYNEKERMFHITEFIYYIYLEEYHKIPYINNR